MDMLIAPFLQFTFCCIFRNYSEYASNPAYKAIADSTFALLSNSSNTMIGDHRYFMQEKFAKSKAAGKPWQVFVAGL